MKYTIWKLICIYIRSAHQDVKIGTISDVAGILITDM